MSRMDRFHFEHQSFGSRRLGVQFGISRSKAKRLMQLLHLEATYPKHKTSIPNNEHQKFPYSVIFLRLIPITFGQQI